MKTLFFTAFTLLLSQNAFAEVMACELDTKTCPDGSVVGRVLNKNCHFADCPVKKGDSKEKAEASDKEEEHE